MGAIPIFHYFIFLLGLLLFSTEINARPEILTATVIEANGDIINLIWVKTEQLLANENLRIWETETNGLFKHNEHLVKEFGPFETYHDLDDSSAILFFRKRNNIYGTIGDNYHIIGLPISELDNDQVVGQSDYIKIMEKSNSTPSCSTLFSRPPIDTAHPFQDIQQPSCSHWRKRPHDIREYFSNFLPEKRSRFDEDVLVQKKTHLGDFYPEILILVNHEMIETCTNMKIAYIAILMQMNAVAMLFAKLKDHVNIHINIAAIVFETRSGDFFFTNEMYINAISEDQFRNFLFRSIWEYINVNSYSDKWKNPQIFSEDAFDFFLFMTSDLRPPQIINGTFRGFSTKIIDILEQRSKRRLLYTEKEQLGAVIPPSDMLQYYVNIARQIAHLMRVENDGVQSHYIMGNNEINHHCVDCLKWSRKSVESFESFFRQDTNRCFLMNKPRSLYEFGKPQETLTPKQQCNCYNYDISPLYAMSLFLAPYDNACQRRLLCIEYQTPPLTNTNVRAPPPVDGTPCNAGKVCWRRTCVPSNN